jgi:hypothetical protein
MNSFSILAAIVALLGMSSTSMAVGVLLHDEFDSENSGSTGLSYTSFTNWDVTDGTVDIVANGYLGISGDGSFVDLDGSSFDAGVLSSKTEFSFDAGTPYRISFLLGGSQRGDTNTVQFSVASVSDTITLASGDPYQLFAYEWTPAVDTQSKIVFENINSDDNLGLFLDDVKLEVIPEPASGLVLGVGLAALPGRRRRT